MRRTVTSHARPASGTTGNRAHASSEFDRNAAKQAEKEEREAARLPIRHALLSVPHKDGLADWDTENTCGANTAARSLPASTLTPTEAKLLYLCQKAACTFPYPPQAYVLLPLEGM